jgi:hypothetical protein
VLNPTMMSPPLTIIPPIMPSVIPLGPTSLMPQSSAESVPGTVISPTSGMLLPAAISTRQSNGG